MDAYLATVKKKTGKTPDDFRKLAQKQGLTKHGEIVKWLKSEFALGHGHANAVAHSILNVDAPAETDDDGIAKHFTGAKAAWRPAYDELLTKLNAFGSDIRVAPTKSYLSLMRGDKKFGVVQITGKRLDVGIKRKDTPAEGRFTEAGSWNTMVTHRVQIDDRSQLDAELLTWLYNAYENAE